MSIALSALSLSPFNFEGGGAAAYATAFLAGVAVDLTPCVFPLIPITVAVFGAKGVSRGKALFLATAYVLGMATLYTTLGLIVGAAGGAFGTWLANPWVVVPIVLMLLALSASMFGAFDLQLPTSLQNRLNTVGGAGPLGAYLMGLVSGLISAPCTGPVLAGLLTVVAKSAAEGESLFYGGSLLFVYALGMGTLFFAIALGASLFKPGKWMEYVKSVFGVGLIVMALYFLRPLSPTLANFIAHPSYGLWVGMALVAVAIPLGAVHLSFGGPVAERLRKGVAVAVMVVGGQLALNNVLYVPPADWTVVKTVDELETALQKADEADKPLLVDFAADWCLPCKELEKLTLHDERVEPLLSERYFLIKVDVTEGTDDHDLMKAAFGVETLPGVVVYGSDADLSKHTATVRAGEPLPPPEASFNTVVEPEVFLEAVGPVD